MQIFKYLNLSIQNQFKLFNFIKLLSNCVIHPNEIQEIVLAYKYSNARDSFLVL